MSKDNSSHLAEICEETIHRLCTDLRPGNWAVDRSTGNLEAAFVNNANLLVKTFTFALGLDVLYVC